MAEIGGAEGTFRVEIDGPDGAPTILLSHALGADLSMWDAVTPILAKTFRVIRYDARGHGGSSVVDRPTSMAELGADALRVMDACGVEKAHFLGLSMGGMVGQWLLAHAPHRLDRVILANTSAASPPPSGWNARLNAIAVNGMASLVDGVMARWFTEAFREREADVVAAVARTFVSTSPVGYAACCAALRDMDQRWSARSAANETLVIVGERDSSTPPQAGRALQAAIPGAKLASLDVAHLSCVEAPEAFADIVMAFLTAPKRGLLKRPLVAVGKRAAAPAARKRAAKVALAARAAIARPAKVATAQAAAKSSGARRGASPDASPRSAAVPQKSVGKPKGKTAASTARRKTEPSSPKTTSPKTSSPKTSTPKTSTPKTSASSAAKAKPSQSKAPQAKSQSSKLAPIRAAKSPASSLSKAALGRSTAKPSPGKAPSKKSSTKSMPAKSAKSPSPAASPRGRKTNLTRQSASSSKGPEPVKTTAKPPKSGGSRRGASKGRPPRR